LANIVDRFLKAFEAVDIEARLAAVEARAMAA
jgi:hypothetical protein